MRNRTAIDNRVWKVVKERLFLVEEWRVSDRTGGAFMKGVSARRGGVYVMSLGGRKGGQIAR